VAILCSNKLELTLQSTKVIIVPDRIIWSWYTGHWRIGCYIWYSEEGTGRGSSPNRPLIVVQNVTPRPSTATVPIIALLYNDPLLYGFNVPVKRLNKWMGGRNWTEELQIKVNNSRKILYCMSSVFFYSPLKYVLTFNSKSYFSTAIMLRYSRQLTAGYATLFLSLSIFHCDGRILYRFRDISRKNTNFSSSHLTSMISWNALKFFPKIYYKLPKSLSYRQFHLEI